MILMDKDELKRANFTKKKQTYDDSSFKIAKKVATHVDWDLENVNQQQKWMATQAVETWSVKDR